MKKRVIVADLIITVFPKEASIICEKLQWLKLHLVQPIFPNMPFNVIRVYFRTVKYSDFDAESSFHPKLSEMIPRIWLPYCSVSKKIYCPVYAIFNILVILS